MLCDDFEKLARFFDNLLVWHDLPHVMVELFLLKKVQDLDNLKLVLFLVGESIKTVD